MGFTVIQPGLLTTIQDEGRFGYERYGMTPSGPEDPFSFHVANILAGNDQRESALEATILGPTLRFDAPCIIAIAGADMKPVLDGRPCPMYRAVRVQSGDELRMSAAETGCRAYIALCGGIDAPPVMGSRATAIVNQVGGYEGRKLRAGDVVALRTPDNPPRTLEGRFVEPPPMASGECVVRVIPGPQQDAFTAKGWETFVSTPYAVSPDFDRMGIRLDGEKIEHKTDGNILSDGMAMGAVQVPDSGKPIVMMAERQTVGGYTKIATVISADLPVLGQRKAGDVLRFRAVTLEETHRLWRETNDFLTRLRERMDAASREPRRYRVIVNGVAYPVTVERVE